MHVDLRKLKEKKNENNKTTTKQNQWHSVRKMQCLHTQNAMGICEIVEKSTKDEKEKEKENQQQNEVRQRSNSDQYYKCEMRNAIVNLIGAW